MAENPWYPHYVGDYQQKTSHLSLIEHGAYRLLLDHYYGTGNPLPSDHAILYRICRVSERKERKIIDKIIAEFFTLDGVVYRQAKCDEEITKRLKYSESQSAKAKRGHELRHQPRHLPDDSRSTSPESARGRVPQPQPQSEGKGLPPIPPLPDWVPLPEWTSFIEMRRQMRGSAFTRKAQSLALSKLDDLRKQGYDPVCLINEAVLKSWKSFYPPKENHNANGTDKPKPNSVDRRLAALYRAGGAHGDKQRGAGGEVSHADTGGIAVVAG